MDEIYEIVHPATCRFFGIDEVYKLVINEMYEIGRFMVNLLRNLLSILQNLRCLSCKSINFVLVVKPTLMSLFWFFEWCLFVWLFGLNS